MREFQRLFSLSSDNMEDLTTKSATLLAWAKESQLDLTDVAMPAELIPGGNHVRRWIRNYNQSQYGDVAILLIGVRNLKQINQRYGIDIGDAVLTIVGDRLNEFLLSNLAGRAMAARLSGREFLLGLTQPSTIAESGAIADSILALLAEDIYIEGAPLHISPRIGIALAQPGEQGKEVLERAGSALAAAYASKGAKSVTAKSRRVVELRDNVILESDLSDAIIERQISVVFQPQFEVSTGRLVGAEALARWQHPKLGAIGADRLFAAADRGDLREKLSFLIQDLAITDAATWRGAMSDLRLSVNLGAEELGGGYADALFDILDKTGFPASRLTLELTEESLVRDMDGAARLLQHLREHNIRVAVDDFGTGYSSLAYLKTLPLDYLKLDKAMTPDIAGSGKDRIVVRSIIAMGKAIGLKIIAEGVEHAHELAMLNDEGCDYFQGYLRSPPLSHDEFENFALLNV